MPEPMSPPTSAVAVESLSRTYSSSSGDVEALRHATVHVEPGEFVAIMGPSGSGKSTLLRIIGALDTATSGSVMVDGVQIDALGVAGRARLRRDTIGYVFQEFNLLAGLTAAENVAAPLELGGMAAGPAQDIAVAGLERVGLSDKADRFPDDLSGGERQRVAVARGLVGDRKVLLADEPTGALDSETGAAIVDLLRATALDGVAVVTVTHDASVAASADRVLHMGDGVLSSNSVRSGR